jgi:hypothetical protein
MTSAGRWFRVNTTWSQSDWIATLSPGARLAWIELLSHIKAHGYDGRLRGVTRYTVSRLYNIPIEDVSALFDAAVGHGAMAIVDGEVVIAKWGEYQGDPTGAQRVRKHREKEKDVTPVTRNDRVVTATETETSTNKDSNESSSGSDKPNTDRAKIKQVFEYWRTRCGHEGATLTADRRDKIKARLKKYTPEQLEQAIEGARASPFHQGENPQRTRYDWIETIFKNDSTAEKLMLAAQNGHRNGKPVVRESI